MFANLKNKLIEEVKASPSKFQQFANAAQAAVTSSSSTTPSSTDSNNTSTTNENFFSITEEDTPQNSPFKPQKLPIGASLRGRASTQSLNSSGVGASGGAIPRTRKLSNSSMASDVSFRLPSYDAPAVYHLQSDLDASGSEMDDSASTARLDVITKEQLYDAYKKSLDRYHKYRCRYTDLAKKYKDLERDSSKARSVLVETQEKAIRRISELREQCTLEQQAKAHLEEALRIEMDDMSCKMQAYQTKLKLLGENPEHVVSSSSADAKSKDTETLIDLGDNAIENSGVASNGESPINLIAELQQKISKLEQKLTDREKQLNELNLNYENATATTETLRKQEEENVLLLAQTKQAIHTELEQKESEVLQLKEKLKQKENDLEEINKKDIQLVDSKEQLKKLQSAKHEADAKVIATEHLLTNLRSEFAAKEEKLTAVESQLKAYKLESEQRLQELRQHNEQLNEMVERYQQNEVSLAEVDNELNRTKNDNDNLRRDVAQGQRRTLELEELLETEREAVVRLNEEIRNNEEVKSKCEQQTQKLEQLERELRLLSEQSENSESENIAALKAELETLTTQHNAELIKLKTNADSKEKELKTITNKLNKQKKQYEQQQKRLGELNVDVENLKAELVERENKLEKYKQIESEKNELQERVTAILQEIAIMQEHMQQVQLSHSELEAEKRSLESKIEIMARQQEDVNVDSERLRELWQEWEQRALNAESKLEQIVCENTKLLERNCLLEEQNNHIEKQFAERERQYVTEEARVSDMRLKLQTNEDDLAKLNEKMKQVLDENSRMHNAQELMDHDYRTLQDKYDSLEKEKLSVEDALKCTQADVESNLQVKIRLETELDELKRAEQDTAKNLANFETERENLQQQLNALKAVQSADQSHKSLLEEAQQRNGQLQSELNAITSQLKTFEQSSEALERAKEEIELLREQRDSLEKETEEQITSIIELRDQVKQLETASDGIEALSAELVKHKTEIAEKEANLTAMTQQVETLKQQNEELEKLKEREELLRAELITLQNDHECTRKELLEREAVEQRLKKELEINSTENASQLVKLEEKCQKSNIDVERLHESNDALLLEIDNLKTKYEMQLSELQIALANQEAQVQNSTEMASKLALYDQMQIEVEYLNKHTKQLENELALAKEATQASNSDSVELKDKLKSLQCELYVLQENAEQHAAQIKEKESLYDEMRKLQVSLDEKSTELARQREHSDFITQQNDSIQKELLLLQQQFAEAKQQYQESNTEFLKYKEQTEAKTQMLEQEKEALRVENTRNSETIALLNKEVSEINGELQTRANKIQELQVELTERENIEKTAQEPQKSAHSTDAERLRGINEQLQRELEELKHKSSGESKHLQEEIDDLQTSNKQMAERILELEQLQASLMAQKSQLNANTSSSNEIATQSLESGDVNEKAELENRVKEIMNEVQDVTNRNLFLEQKCENFLILEQSNERLKLQNAKLSRQLDETLVSMQHSESISANTEFEYLKNIMFQYLTGNTNNETLVKVISAVLKFSPQQTQVALEKEHQRRSLLNKIL